MIEAERLNADFTAARLSGAALPLQGEGGKLAFAEVAVFVSQAQLQQMKDVISAVERVVKNSEWPVASSENGKPATGTTENGKSGNVRGVFYGYDFHLNSEGAHLIEINTNAGGAFANALLLESQRDVDLPGEGVCANDPEQAFVDMFRSELQDGPLRCIAIVDEHPEGQYLYPEFLLAQRMFERAGIIAFIVDPSQLHACDEGLFVGEQKIDLVYNRLTDFKLEKYPDLQHAWRHGHVVLTPNPEHYARYADKRNLARLTNASELRAMGVDETDIAILQAGIPHTFVVRPELEETLWNDRKQLFFKPCSGYGSKGAYRGDKLTRRVYGEILHSDYVAQQIAPPGERCVAEGISLKYDVRCYVYKGEIQLVAARLYQGQTTNFRTSGGGFAPVRIAC